MQYKLKHRLSAALMAGAMCCTMIPAASAEEISTPEIADTFVPEITDSVTPDLSQITENLYNDLPDAPTGSYLGSMGLPVATGETKISISAWVSDLYDGTDAHMDADALNGNESTVIVGRNPDADYAVVPLLVQTEYPANSATAEVVLPKGVEVLSYASTDADLISADDAEQAKILHQTYAEQSAAATGFYVKAFSDFTAQFVYASPDGTTLQKSIHVQLSDDAAPAQLYADNGVATLAAGPTPPYATGKITSIAKEGGTWLIWFNGQEAYCCSHGLNGQPNGCPTYTFDHVSRLEPGQYTPGNHYANQINIWGGLGQLSLDMLDSKPVVMSADTEQPDLISEIYDETQQWIITNYPDSYAAQAYVAAAEELADGTAVQSGENGYYTYIYNPPAGYAWQIVALVGEEIAGGTEIPDVPSAPEPQYYSASWTAPAQSARGSFDLTFTVNTDKYQLNTLEKVDGAVITVTPSQTSGSVDGGSWKMTPAGAQTITTSGHTQDDNYHLNGGDGSATWTVHYEVSKTSTSTLSGQEGPFTSQAEADAAAEAAKNAAINQLKNEAQGMVDAAIASARAQLANITFSYDEITIPHGFDTTSGALSSHQTITVPANSSNYYQMKNDEWSVKVSIDKIDSETKQRIKGDAEFKIFEWDTVRQCYIPNGGYNQYKVERQADGTYKVINHSNYANGSDNIYYTQRNEGKFVIVESHAPSGYYGDWTDVTKPGTAGSVLGKRAYAFEITKALDGQTIWLGNADYNADITTANSGGTLIDTGEGIVTITFGSRNADKTYTTDPTGIASNEDSYTMHADVDTMQNDRTLGSITLSKADFDAARYLAAGSNGDSTLEGAVYDLYAAEDILHPNGVSGIVDYSKITDSSGNPIWHTTVLTNGAWKSDYLPVLKKDYLVASAAIKDGKLAFSNLYLGRYYLVERATGIVIPVDSNGQYYLSGKYPLLNKKLEPTGSYAALASNGTEYIDYARVLPVVEEGKVGVGLYKLDRGTCDLTDEAPYSDGCKTRASLLNGGSNRADIPADAKMVAGAVYELYTADDIYSISGELLAAADTLLGTATTDENGLAYFDVDVPLRGEHYGSSDAHDWTTNSGRYYLREISVPDGYLIEQSVIPVEFTYENQFIAWQIVDCLHSDKQTTVEIDKRAFASDSDTTFALPGATLTVTDWNGNVVDSWESSDTARVIRGLHLSHDFAGNRDTSKIYTLTETRPAGGYTTARSIQFRLEQATDENGYLQETAIWVLRESEDAEYQSGSIISPVTFSDDTVATLPAKLRAFWDKLLGKNPDADGVVIANWYCVKSTLVVNFTDAANDRAIAKCLRESDFSDLTFDTVYLNGAAAPAFFADKQVAEKPADAEITYSASWILLKDADGFSQTVTMLDAPTRVKISKADITTHEEIPGATLRVLDKNGNVVDEWVSENTPHYIEVVLVAGETYTLEETLVPDGSGYIPANSIQFTVEDDGKVQHVFMQDDYTKLQVSKTDIATGKEISGARLKITDTDGKTVAEWLTDGTPHYMERIPMGTYTLTETMAPTEQGYVRAESVTFAVGPTENIQRVEMKDDFTKVEISKADMTDGRELPGAKLKITDASGSTIAEWETNGQPHRIERLKPGDYTLTETAAPAGYLLSEEVHFTVQETGEIQKVTMYDAPAHSLILTKRDIATNAKLADARLTIRDAYGTTIDRWTTTDGDHAIRVLPERSAAKDPHKNLLLLSDDTSEHVYTMVEELAPNGYLIAESITFKVMQMNDTLVVFVWQDGGWQKSSEGYLAMYDERTDTPVPLMKTFPQTGNIL